MYIYGKNVVYEKLFNNSKINKLYLSKKFNDKKILDLLKDKNIDITYLDNFKLDKMVNGLHQGIIALVNDYKTYDLKEIINNINKKNPLIVMLDHIEDPHNFGAIIRTSEALGVDAIIIPEDRCVGINSTVIKTSVGAIENIKIIKVTNLVNTIKYLKDKGYWIIGTDMSSTSISEIDYKMPICLVIGNEGKGISRIVRDNCDYIASIPMTGKVNSLNASVATGIIIYEIINRRG